MVVTTSKPTTTLLGKLRMRLVSLVAPRSCCVPNGSSSAAPDASWQSPPPSNEVDSGLLAEGQLRSADENVTGVTVKRERGDGSGDGLGEGSGDSSAKESTLVT